MIRSVTSVRQPQKQSAPQAAAPAARPAAAAAPGPARQQALSPQKYKEDVIRIGGQLAAAIEQLRTARQVPGSAHHHQAVLRLAEAVARRDALMRLETPVNWKWFHNMDRVVRESLPELPDWAHAELDEQRQPEPAPAPEKPVRRATAKLKAGPDPKEVEHQRMKRALAQHTRLDEVLKLAAKASWEVDRLQGTTTAHLALERARQLATSAADALRIHDAIDALPYPFDKRKLAGEKRKTLALGQTLPGAPAETAALRQRAAKLPAEG